MLERFEIGACHTKMTRQISMTKTNPGMHERSFSETPSLFFGKRAAKGKFWRKRRYVDLVPQGSKIWIG